MGSFLPKLFLVNMIRLGHNVSTFPETWHLTAPLAPPAAPAARPVGLVPSPRRRAVPPPGRDPEALRGKLRRRRGAGTRPPRPFPARRAPAPLTQVHRAGAPRARVL